MRSRARLAPALAAALAAGVLAGCTAAPLGPTTTGAPATSAPAASDSDGRLVIATFFPSSARGSASTTALRAAVDLAVHDAVTAGGVPGVDLLVAHRDAAGSRAVPAFAKWASKQRVDAVIAAPGTAAAVTDALAGRQRMPIVLAVDDAPASKALQRRLQQSDPWSRASNGAASAYDEATALAIAALMVGDSAQAIGPALDVLAEPGVPCTGFDHCRYELANAPLDTDGLAVSGLSEWVPSSH
jgi:hypothetical protein